MKRLNGFTFVEMLLVLFIIVVVVSIPIPLYLRHTKRVIASEAIATMAAIRQAMRDYFVNNNSFIDVASGDLSDPPPQGLDLKIGVAQYFSSQAYSVDSSSPSSPRFSNPGVVDFLITVNGADAVACGQSDCALQGAAVVNYRLEMDSTGRIFISYDGGDNWQKY